MRQKTLQLICDMSDIWLRIVEHLLEIYLMVKIHETVDTLTLQFLANVGNVGPVTLKKRPIVMRAPTMPAMKSHVAH